MMKIDSAELMTQAQGMYKSNRVYIFIRDLDVDRDTALKILDFLKDYSDMFVESKKIDREFYEKQINGLLGQLDNTADRLREIAAGIETGEY